MTGNRFSIARWCGEHKKNEGIMPSSSNATFNFYLSDRTRTGCAAHDFKTTTPSGFRLYRSEVTRT